MVQGEPGRVGLWVRADGEVEEEGRDVCVEVDGAKKAIG